MINVMTTVGKITLFSYKNQNFITKFLIKTQDKTRKVLF